MKKSIVSLLALSVLSGGVLATQVDVDSALKARNIALAQQEFLTLESNEKVSLAGKILQARIYLALDKTEDAYDLLEPLIKGNSNHVELHLRFGQSAVGMAQKASIFSKLGYAKEGRKAWEKAVEIDPTHIQALENVIGFHTGAPSIAGGDKDKAKAYIETLKKLDFELGTFKLVMLHLNEEQFDSAHDAVNQGIEKMPISSDLLFSKALVHTAQEQWDDARSSLVKALEYAIDDQQKQQALYQQGRVAAKSEQEIQSGIDALTALLAMPEPARANWAKLRLAQLYVMTQKVTLAQELLEEIDDPQGPLKDEVKKLKRKIKKMS